MNTNKLLSPIFRSPCLSLQSPPLLPLPLMFCCRGDRGGSLRSSDLRRIPLTRFPQFRLPVPAWQQEQGIPPCPVAPVYLPVQHRFSFKNAAARQLLTRSRWHVLEPKCNARRGAETLKSGGYSKQCSRILRRIFSNGTPHIYTFIYMCVYI